MSLAISKPLGRRPKTRFWQSREAFFTDAGLFLLGAAGAYSVNVIGALPGDELLILPAIPLLVLARGKRAFKSQYLWFYLLLVGWLLGPLIVDVYTGSPLASRLKGTARVIFFGLDFVALAIIINGKPRRYVIFALSIVAVMFGFIWQFRGDFLLQWKFGGASTLAIVSLLISSYFYANKKYWVYIAVSLVLAALNLKYGFRSQMAIVLVAAALALPIFRHKPGRNSGILSTVRVVLLLGVAGGAAYLANAA